MPEQDSILTNEVRYEVVDRHVEHHLISCSFSSCSLSSSSYTSSVALDRVQYHHRQAHPTIPFVQLPVEFSVTIFIAQPPSP